VDAPAAVAVLPEGGAPVSLPKTMQVGELAKALDLSIVDVIRALVNMGVMATINQTIDFETASLVAGDIFASEDHNGTLKTILTRSLDRGQIFAGKVLAAVSYAAFALVLMGIVAILAGGLESGFNSLTTLSGTKVGPAKALGLVTASLGVYLLPMLAIASIGLLLSTITRNSAAAVVGALMIALVLQIGSIIPGLEEIRPYLLPRQFDAWQGLLREPTDWAPIVRAAWVCAAYAVPSLFAAYVVFLRRDVAGG